MKKNSYLQDFNEQMVSVRLESKKRNYRIKVTEIIETENGHILVKGIPYLQKNSKNMNKYSLNDEIQQIQSNLRIIK